MSLRENIVTSVARRVERMEHEEFFDLTNEDYFALVLDLILDVLTSRPPGAEVRQWHQPITVQPKGRTELGDDFPPGTYLILDLDALRGIS